MLETLILENVKLELEASPIRDIGISANDIYITAKNEPPPTVGQYFILLFPSSRSNMVEGVDSPNYVRDRIYFDVVCGARTALAPTDRLSYYLTKEYKNLYIIKDIVIFTIAKLHGKNNAVLETYLAEALRGYPQSVRDIYALINFADIYSYIDSEAEAVPVYQDYFNSTNQEITQTDRPSGHTLTAKFYSPQILYRVSC